MNKYKYLLIDSIFYCISIFVFMVSQLSIVGGTFMSGSIFSYNYTLRVIMNCVAIVFAVLAAVVGKSKKRTTVVRLLLSISIIVFILVFGMGNNVVS